MKSEGLVKWVGLQKSKTYQLTRVQRHIGVSNFDNNDLDELLKTAKEYPEVNQIELGPTCWKKVEHIYKRNAELGIVVEVRYVYSSDMLIYLNIGIRRTCCTHFT